MSPQNELSDGILTLDGQDYMRDVKGALIPVALVKPVDRLIDQTVRKLLGYALDLSGQISRFKSHTFDDVSALQALLAAEYGATLGGAKGNITLTTVDGCFRVTVQVADQIEFGPELQVAKQLVDACLSEWAAGSRDEIRAVVTRAFQVDQSGRINRAEIFMLLRVAIEDERWQRAMDAVRDSIRVIGSKTYVRFHRRSGADAPWEPVTIDLAAT